MKLSHSPNAASSQRAAPGSPSPGLGTTGRRSTSTTDLPISRRAMADAEPAEPAPITITAALRAAIVLMHRAHPDEFALSTKIAIDGPHRRAWNSRGP